MARPVLCYRKGEAMSHPRRQLRSNGPAVLLAMLFAASLITRCAPDSNAPPAGVPDHSGATTGASTGSATGGNAGSTTGGDASGPLIGGECDGGDLATQCPFPPSICSGQFTLVYYESPACVSQRCQWTPSSTTCYAGCNGEGACNPNSSTTSGSTFIPPADDAGDAEIQDAAADHTVAADAGVYERGDATIDDGAAADDAARALDGAR